MSSVHPDTPSLLTPLPSSSLLQRLKLGKCTVHNSSLGRQAKLNPGKLLPGHIPSRPLPGLQRQASLPSALASGAYTAPPPPACLAMASPSPHTQARSSNPDPRFFLAHSS